MKKLILVLLAVGFWAPSAGAVAEDTIPPPDVIIDSIQSQLYRLKVEYLTRIRSRRHRREAMAIVDEIQSLLSMLDVPEQPRPLQPEELQSLLQSMRDEAFADQKLEILRTFLLTRKPSITVEQVASIMDVFTFDNDKVKAVRLMYPYIQDKENGYKLVNKLTFSDEKDELMRIFTSGQ